MLMGCRPGLAVWSCLLGVANLSLVSSLLYSLNKTWSLPEESSLYVGLGGPEVETNAWQWREKFFYLLASHPPSNDKVKAWEEVEEDLPRIKLVGDHFIYLLHKEDRHNVGGNPVNAYIFRGRDLRDTLAKKKLCDLGTFNQEFATKRLPERELERAGVSEAETERTALAQPETTVSLHVHLNNYFVKASLIDLPAYKTFLDGEEVIC